MNLRHIEDNPEQRSFLANAINSQLKQIFGESGNAVPDELVEYIVVLLAHGKPEEEVSHTLVDFLHDRADPFASWLFQYIATNWSRIAPAASVEGKSDISHKPAEMDVSRKEIMALEAGSRLRSAISIPEENIQPKRQTISGKRGRRHSPEGVDEEAEGSRARRKSLKATVTHGNGQRDSRMGLDGNPGKVREHEPTRRLFASALGAVNAQFDRSFPRPKVPGGELGDEVSKPSQVEDQKKAARGRSVFDRLGAHPQTIGMPMGDHGTGIKKDRVSKDKQSVFERLQSRNNVMNMEVRMDLQTHEADNSQEPTGRSSTITFTVNHSTQGQKHSNLKSGDMINISNCHSTTRALDTAPVDRGSETTKQWEVQQLREKVARMQSQVEELRARSHESKSEAVALEKKSDEYIQSVCVRNVHFMANKAVVAAHFSSCGRVCDVVFPLGPFGEPKGYCFVEFASSDSIDMALQLGGSLLMGRVISVVRKRPQSFELPQTTRFSYSTGPAPGRGGIGGRSMYNNSPWGIHSGGFGYRRGTNQLIRASSSSVQEASSTVIQPQLASSAVPESEPSVVVSAPLDSTVTCAPLNENGDLDFEIDTGTQDDDIRAVLDGEAN